MTKAGVSTYGWVCQTSNLVKIGGLDGEAGGVGCVASRRDPSRTRAHEMLDGEWQEFEHCSLQRGGGGHTPREESSPYREIPESLLNPFLPSHKGELTALSSPEEWGGVETTTSDGGGEVIPPSDT